ncbi:protein of unknown function [Magnetospira sp. QH-2]|nr:protein of unknown function [Magnetospira sp. QH-2]
MDRFGKNRLRFSNIPYDRTEYYEAKIGCVRIDGNDLYVPVDRDLHLPETRPFFRWLWGGEWFLC